MKINHIFTETKWTRRALALTFGLTMMICALFLLFGSRAAIKNAHAATIFTVNSTAATGDTSPDGTCDTCTLREAIQEANFVAGADRINFAIPEAGPHTIPGSPLPSITKPVTIDGYTQGGPKRTP